MEKKKRKTSEFDPLTERLRQQKMMNTKQPNSHVRDPDDGNCASNKENSAKSHREKKENAHSITTLVTEARVNTNTAHYIKPTY